MKEKYDLIIIGGGPSGMFSAIWAKKFNPDWKILILEKNNKVGEKLNITGGGRCNITNNIPNFKKFLENFKESKKFLYSAFSQFSVNNTFSFFEKNGLPLVTEGRNRVFPSTQKAKDVTDLLINLIKKNNIEIKGNQRVIQLFKVPSDNGQKTLEAVKTASGDKFFAKKFILATGGLSHKETGATGDGFKILEKLGHTIHKPNPSLVPLITDNRLLHEASGIAPSFCKIRFIQNDKTFLSKKGKILFTHFGLSGPLIINSSFKVKEKLKLGRVFASIDLFPDTEEKMLDKRIIKLFKSKKLLKNILPEIIEEKLSKAILNHFPKSWKDKEATSLLKEERKIIVKKLKNLEMEILRTAGFERAIIADGGVDLQEIDFKTMRSKIYDNLYILGDLLNINRPSGGFSLQLCWTTGYVAGKNINTKK